ncbi:MAG: PAS domain-containing protein [Anaerolineae bacterium]|nr:PAS domain-containing protein [Anaerolineae bacterium]
MTAEAEQSPEALLAEITALRAEITKLQQEKAELELLVEMTAEHSDRVTDELYSTVEATQQESAERFEVITGTVPVPVVISRGLDDILVYANMAASKMLGVAREALLGRSMAEFYSKPGERERILAAVAQQGAVDNWEIQGQQADDVYFWAMVFIRPLTFNDEPCLLEIYSDLTAHKHAELERARLQQEVIEAQQKAIQELSTPVIPILDAPGGGIIVVPLIGSIDSMRARDITRSLLAGISRYGAKVIILDITGVPIVDSGTANHLHKTIQAARLKGARTIVTGISEAVAETIVDLGIDWSEITTLSDLQTGLTMALYSLGIELY